MLRQTQCLCCLAVGLAAAPLGAARDPAAMCDDAAVQAAADSGVPLSVLLAITRVETGRAQGGTLTPWPWTINQAGTGHWFDTAAEATRAAEAALAEGRGNLDIGCFQLNHHWHGAAFASLDQMFDPQTNAGYAAAFLSDLYREKADWTAAVGAYHSRSDGPAEKYLTRIASVLADLGELPEDRLERSNSYPLLRAGGQASAGSLVPRQTAGTPLIGEAP